MPESKPQNEAKTPTPGVKAEAPKAVPTAGEKKPETPAKVPAPKATPAPGEKKPDAPAKAPDPKSAPIPGEKKPEATAKATDPKPKDTAVEPPKGVRITQVLADRLEKPSEDDLKKIPQPKEGEGLSMRLHPGYFFEFLEGVGMLILDSRDMTIPEKAEHYTPAEFEQKYYRG